MLQPVPWISLATSRSRADSRVGALPRISRLLRRLALASGLLAVAGIAWPSVARADIVLLKDGRVIERPGVTRGEGSVTVPFENGEVVIPDDMVAEVILESGPAFVPKTPEEEAKAAKGLVPFKGRWMKLEQVQAAIRKTVEERKAKVAEIREHMLWRNRWKTRTKHFEFEYTVPPDVYQYYGDLMEAYYKEFAKTWKIKQPKDLGRLKVCFYTDAEKFQQIGGVGRGVLGYFRFVKPLELNFYYDRLDPDLTEQVMYHEANHYLQKLMKPDFKMPHFPGESIAEYYGAGKYDPESKTLTVGHVLEGRLAEVKMTITSGKYVGLEKMITTDRMYEHYNWGWTLVHFLMSDKTTAKRFEKFVKTIVDGKKVKRVPYTAGLVTVPMPEVWEQFKKALKLKSDEDVKALEKAWHTFIDEELELTSSRGLEDAAEYASREGLRLKAQRLYREAIEAGSTSPRVYRRYADFLSSEGEHSKAAEHLRKAITFAPLEPSLYSALGKLLRRKGEGEEGEKMLRLAGELDPDDPWLAFEIEQALKGDDD